MPTVLCVGEGMAVLVARPGPLQASGSFDRDLGGAEANVATTLARLGVETAWLSRVGDDGFGRYLTGELTARGVDTSAVATDPERPTGVYVKERGAGSGAAYDLGAGESRMHYYRAGSAASALSPDDLARPATARLLARADLVHLSGITPALSAGAARLVTALADAGARLSFDLNFRPALWGGDVAAAARVLGDVVRRSHVVLMGADEAEAVFGTGEPEALRALFGEPRYLVVKDDAHRVVELDGEQRTAAPALRVDVVERVGAGDAFAGGYLAGLLDGLAPVRRLRLGHLCAATVLAAPGDTAHLPPRAGLDALTALDDDAWAALDLPAATGAVR